MIFTGILSVCLEYTVFTAVGDCMPQYIPLLTQHVEDIQARVLSASTVWLFNILVESSGWKIGNMWQKDKMKREMGRGGGANLKHIPDMTERRWCTTGKCRPGDMEGEKKRNKRVNGENKSYIMKFTICLWECVNVQSHVMHQGGMCECVCRRRRQTQLSIVALVLQSK